MSQLDDVFDDVDRHHHRYVICERFSADHLREQFAALHASGEKSSVLSFHTLTLSTRSLLITRCCDTANQRPHHCCHLANNVEYVDYSRRQVRACPAFIVHLAVVRATRHLRTPVYTVGQKKQDTKLLPITLPNIGRFSKFCYC